MQEKTEQKKEKIKTGLRKFVSKYTVQIIFSHFDERKKLKVARRSKDCQNFINRSLINYKIFSGRYIEYTNYPKQGKKYGKEFDVFTDRLLYEGEFLNGERNGTGKEYDLFKKIKFEGEYINGKRHGKGKEYSGYGNTIFEGNYLQGKRNGNGIESDEDNGELIFKGRYKDNRRIILNNELQYYKVKEYDGNILRFEGDYDGEGKRIIGREYSKDEKLIFEGKYCKGKKLEGKEFFYKNNLIDNLFIGEYNNGKKWKGKIYNLDGDILYEINNGESSCFMESDFDNGIIYLGEYKDGEKNGKGKEYNEHFKLIYEGEFKNGLRNWIGKEYDDKGNFIFEGKYEEGKRFEGKEKNSIIVFNGVYYNGNKMKGKLYKRDKLEYEGQFLFGKKWHGKGYDESKNIIYELEDGTGNVKEFNDKGELIYSGEYKKGKKNGKGYENTGYFSY